MTSQEMANLSIEPNAFESGIASTDYGKHFKESNLDRVRHWMAFQKAPPDSVGPNGEKPDRDGNLFVENVLKEDVRVLISETRREVFDAEFGLITKGQTSIACLPDELEPARHDRLLLLDRLFLERRVIACSGGESDLLGRRYISEIVSIVADGQSLFDGDYELEEDEDGMGKITWSVPPPQIALISIRYHPQFVYLDISDRNPPLGSDGKRLPIRGILTLEKR